MSIKNWVKFNESHWADGIKDKVSWDRDYEIGELFYDFEDMGFKSPIITHKIFDSNFSHPGKKVDHLYGVLYTGYTIVCRDSISRRNKIKENIQIYENLILLLNRIDQLGFKINYNYSNGSIELDLYHPDDIIKKDTYIKDEDKMKSKRKVGLDQVEEKLSQSLSKIADVRSSMVNLRDLAVSKKVIIISTKSDKYSIQNIYTIITKILKLGIDSGLYQTKIFGNNILIGAGLYQTKIFGNNILIGDSGTLDRFNDPNLPSF